MEKIYRAIQKRLSSAKNEDGNTFIIYFMMMPVLLIFFGFAVDTGIAQYSRNSMQSALDTATQSALATSINPTSGGRPTLSYNQALATTIKAYDTNRSNGKLPFLACQGKEIPWSKDSGTRETPSSGCGFVLQSFTYNPANIGTSRPVITMKVVEYSHYVFLHMLGMETQKYYVESSARLSRSSY